MYTQQDYIYRFYVATALVAAASMTMEPQPKRRKIWCKKWLQRREQNGFYENLMRELALEDVKSYRRWIRMDTSTFEYLLDTLTPHIAKKNTKWRKSITAGERLAVTLRFLATGETQTSLSFQFRMAQNTISGIIENVCRAICEILSTKYIHTPQRYNEWIQVSSKFSELWNFPQCVGALDGKHINIVPPPRSGSVFYNYKKYHSIVLLALVDADLNFIYVDVGSNGRISDGGVFAKSSLSKSLEENSLNIPEATFLPGTSVKVPYVIVADDAFPLNRHIMKPYPGNNLTEEKRIFNYRLSRARRVVENAFGILSARFRIFKTAINCMIPTTKNIVLATCVLHNLLRKKNNDIYIPDGSLDRENICQRMVEFGNWRNERCDAVISFRKYNYKSKESAKSFQNCFCEFFNGNGAVPWQKDMCNLH